MKVSRSSVGAGIRFVRIVLSGMLLIGSHGFAGTWSTENYLSGMDSVHIYLPDTPPALNEKRALMIGLHGCGMSNSDMMYYGGWESIADEMGMVLALPDVPGSGIFTSCWDYYGKDHTRSNKYNDEIIDLANALKARENLNIDSSQVYISGFSSGATQAVVAGCLAPDIFAGVASHSGPGLGTLSTEYSVKSWSYSESSTAALCERFAGANAESFGSQIYSTIHGTADPYVTPDYNATGAEVMSHVYGARNESASRSIEGDGEEVIFSDDKGPRISKVIVRDLAHTWSSTGGYLGFFANDKMDYPDYVTRWLFDNNRRVLVRELEDGDGDGVDESKDCDDADSSVFPGATEICGDGIDQNCSGEDLPCSVVDLDGDGFDELSDCNDLDDTVFPGATEICGDGVDQSCSGADERCPSLWTCVEHFATNTDHDKATPSRARYRRLGWRIDYYAEGSGEKLPYPGMYAIAVLAETSKGFFRVGHCP